jgi:N-acetylglucosaminyldiphosphoundecaprenol N-acetyl-beta-D-mannosaminyltransferase
LSVLGIGIDVLSMTEAVDRIIDCTHSPRTSRVAFVNADCLNQAYTQTDYKGALSECDLVLPDGIGLILASRILGGSLLENVNGTDLFPRLCKRAAHEGTSLFLLGSRKGIAGAAATNMQVMNPRLRVVGTHLGYFTECEEDDLLDRIHSLAADILLLDMGAPRQELWVARNADRLSVPVAVGVGGLFDFYSCRIPRAPRHFREIGLEWLWRLSQEPCRLWRRYLVGNPLFLLRVWRQTRGLPRESELTIEKTDQHQGP